MKLSEILTEDSIVPDVKARDKKSVIDELAEAIVSCETSLDKSALVKRLLKRYRL